MANPQAARIAVDTTRCDILGRQGRRNARGTPENGPPPLPGTHRSATAATMALETCMNRSAIILLLATLAATLGAAALVPHADIADAALLPITNGGFEQADAEGMPGDWEVVGGAVSTDVVHSGRHSLALSHDGEKETHDAMLPGIIETRCGKGKVIYIPADISWAFFRYGHEFLGRVMELALRDVATAPTPAEGQAPRIVQAMTYRQGDRLVVHLLNDVSSFGRSQNVRGESMYIRREVVPIHEIRLTFNQRLFRGFVLIPGNTELPVEETQQGLTVTVPRVDIHAMVVAEP